MLEDDETIKHRARRVIHISVSVYACDAVGDAVGVALKACVGLSWLYMLLLQVRMSFVCHYCENLGF